MSADQHDELPIGWAATGLREVLSVVRGVSYRKEESRKSPADGFVAILRATNIQDMLVFDDLVYAPKADVSETQMLRPGDAVVAASSGSRAVVGKAAQLRHGWQGAFGTFCFVLRPEPAIEPRFLGWFLHTKEYRNRVSSISAGININNLRPEHIEETPFNVPPLAEQERIADALDELLSDLDAGVAAIHRARAKLDLYRASVLKAAVEGSLTAAWRAQHPDAEPASALLERILVERRRRWEEDRLAKFKAKGQEPPKNWTKKYKEPAAPDTTDLPVLPNDWIWVSLDQLSWTAGYGTSVKCGDAPGGIAVLRIPNVVRGRVNLQNLKFAPPDFAPGDEDLVDVGDLLIVRTNGSRTLIGRGAVVRGVTAGPLSFASYLIRLRVVCEPDVLGWVGLLWNSALVRRWVEKRAATSAGQHNISLGVIQTMPIPLPPLAEGEAIVETAEDQLSVIDHVEADLDAKLKAAQSLRQAILRHAFSGQLVPQDPNDEPASELLKRIAVERSARLSSAAKARPRLSAPRRGRREAMTKL